MVSVNFDPVVNSINALIRLSIFSLRTRCRIIIKGLGHVGSSSQRSQETLKNRVTSVLSAVGSSAEFDVLDVFTYSSGSNPVYDAKLSSAEAVEIIIKEFYKFTRRRDPVRRPAELERVNLYHSITPGTRVRISILRVIAFFFVASNEVIELAL